MRKERWIATALVVSAVWIGTLAGCGGGEKASETAQPPAGTTPAPTGETPAPAAGEISLAVGEKIAKERCELCHGASGKGDGPGGAVLDPKPQDWTNHAYMETRTDDQLYESIFNGKGLGMPAWGKTGILTEAEIRSVILKVRSYDPEHKS